ncbi:MAG: hypothetical protein KDA24_21015 [Deltaproteobacteria bacterium]|nr:hypothetical protein [Deltaproteobacteria bacterium]
MNRQSWCALLTGLLVSGCATPPTGETEFLRLEGSQDWFVLWQGFEHAWTHNHRWNRFGNWVEPLDDCGAARCFGAAHSAASGTSADTATFKSELVEITAPGVGFAQATGVIVASDLMNVDGIWTRAQSVRIPLADLPADQAAALRDRESFLAVLNGWDLHAEDEWAAAKPIDFALEVDPPRYVASADAIDVVWRTFLRMGCSTEECFEEGAFSYEITAQLAVIGWDDELSVGGSERFEHTYGWDAPSNPLGHGNNATAEELQLEPIEAVLPRSLPSAGSVAAMTRLVLHLFHWKEGVENVDQHMVEWRSHVGVVEADGSLPLELMFKNWTEGMTQYQGFAYKDVGAATMSTDLVLIEVPGTDDLPRTAWSGYHSWAGEDQSAADDAEAVTRSWEQTQ